MSVKCGEGFLRKWFGAICPFFEAVTPATLTITVYFRAIYEHTEKQRITFLSLAKFPWYVPTEVIAFQYYPIDTDPGAEVSRYCTF